MCQPTRWAWELLGCTIFGDFKSDRGFQLLIRDAGILTVILISRDREFQEKKTKFHFFELNLNFTMEKF